MTTEASTKLYAGLDLHANNTYCAVINQSGQPVFQQRLANELPTICQALQPFQPQLHGVAVESTYNWYWLVDGLQAERLPVQLANPAKIQQYSGLKRTGDPSDALWLAELLRLGILPTGYIYPKEQRGVRDMARRRMSLVQAATGTLLSLQSMVTRYTGRRCAGAGWRTGRWWNCGRRFPTRPTRRRRRRCWSCCTSNGASNGRWRRTCWPGSSSTARGRGC